MVGTDLVCDAVEGRFLQANDVPELRSACLQAQSDGTAAVFLRDSSLGDAIVLAAGLCAGTTMLIGVRASLTDRPHRHPTVLARELTTLDHLSGGRTILALAPPHEAAAIEAVQLCRDMWRLGRATGAGPFYPVPEAINRPAPPGDSSPRLALDLTDGSTPPGALLALVDLVLMPTSDPAVCLVLPA